MTVPALLLVSPLVGAAFASEPQVNWDPKAGGRIRSGYAASSSSGGGRPVASTRLSVARVRSPFSLALRTWSGALDRSSTAQPSRAVTRPQTRPHAKTRRERRWDVLKLRPAAAASVLCVFPHAPPVPPLRTLRIQALHGPAGKTSHRSSRLRAVVGFLRHEEIHAAGALGKRRTP